ncbi:MAG TPA: branched-chain amino acid ABC transporter permease [Reyranella sp.]|nr:branched-chain amino acid ABC transporter permease [Reyranella sp.]
MSAETTTTSAIAPARSVGLLRQYWPWLAAIAAALLLPWLFFDWSTARHSGFVLTMLSEIGLMSVFALSFNMQMGQTGLLSFGHAILFGLGGYCTAHALNAVKAGTLWLPVELVPLAGGLGGLVFGAAFGYVATKQRATAFAMITMGLGELVAACALMFIGFFGGEGGISTDRVTGQSLLGVAYTSSWQVYCLVVAWTAIAAFLMQLQTRTPLGRMANAQRDNFERTQFVGYDPSRIRFYQFTLSGFFAGIGGALYVLVYEIVTFDTVGAAKSATALLATYIGGAGGFFGPILGTFVVVLLQSGVSLISNAWLLYVGVLFIVMVMFAPGGIMGLVARHEPIARIGRLGELVVPYARIFAPGLLSVLGFIALVELTQLTTIGASQNKALTVGGQAVDPHSPLPWLIGAAMLVGGGLWLRREARFFRARWDALIEDAKARGLPV